MGSFVAGLLVVTIVRGLYDYFAQGLLTGVVFWFFGFLTGVPFLVVASVVAYFFAPSIVGHPIRWSAAAIFVSTTVCAFWMPPPFWALGFFVSATAGVFFCCWFAPRRPVGPALGSKRE